MEQEEQADHTEEEAAADREERETEAERTARSGGDDTRCADKSENPQTAESVPGEVLTEEEDGGEQSQDTESEVLTDEENDEQAAGVAQTANIVVAAGIAQTEDMFQAADIAQTADTVQATGIAQTAKDTFQALDTVHAVTDIAQAADIVQGYGLTEEEDGSQAGIVQSRVVTEDRGDVLQAALHVIQADAQSEEGDGVQLQGAQGTVQGEVLLTEDHSFHSEESGEQATGTRLMTVREHMALPQGVDTHDRNIHPEQAENMPGGGDNFPEVHLQFEDVLELSGAGFHHYLQTADNDSDEEDDEEEDMPVADEAEGREEEEQIIQKLAELPVVAEGVEAVWNRYQDLKECSLLFDTSAGMAEFTLHLAMAVASPTVYSKFQTSIDTMNRYCCMCVDRLGVRFPQLKGPADEAWELCWERWQDMWVYAEPVARPLRTAGQNPCVRAAFKLGKGAFKLGKVALKVGRTCTWLTLLPLTLCYRATAFLTCTTIRTSLFVMDTLAQRLRKRGEEDEEEVEAEQCRLLAIERRQVTLPMIEDLLHLVLPACREHRRGADDGAPALTTEARRLAEQIYSSKSDVRMMLKLKVCVLLGWMLSLVAIGVSFIRLVPSLPGKGYENLVTRIDRVWNWCIDLLPDIKGMHKPKDPLRRVDLLLRQLMGAVVELLAGVFHLSSSVLTGLGKGGLLMVELCQQLFCAFFKCAGGVTTSCLGFLASRVMVMVDLAVRLTSSVLQCV
ncbi:uncharacterized protein LOC143287715 [Babylonia areolata]|uniref:uncharacterized protein LOC143287715 n=1 Tax=Babylonia areolata TaxID=304850 RepID=UPI003FD53460